MAKCSVWTVAMFCVSSLMAPAIGWGQIEKASVVGRVSDATGASAPGATIEIVRLATNEVHRAVSTSTGDYTIVELAAGDYELRASLSGFKTFVRTGVRLETGRAHRIDVALEVGQTSERVEVTAAAPLLRTESPEIGDLIDNSKVMQLPVRSRDYLAFTGLLPGVAPSRGSLGGGGLDTQGFNVLGQRRSDNLVFLDGGTFTQSNGVTTFFPNLDALQEVEIKTGLYGAEFGVKPGAQILAVTKSGGNAVHGSLFEYYRNNNFNARNFFDPGPPAVFKQHTFGATVGGPIFVPHVFNGKNKAWFFGGYNGLRLAAVQSLTGVVATEAQKSGVFPSTIKDPLSGQPFPNSTIPISRINAAAKQLIQFWPEPNTAGRGFNFTSPNSTANNRTDQYVIRVDFNISAADHWSARFIHDYTPSVSPNAIQTFLTSSPLYSWGQSIGNTRTFGAAVVNEFGVHNFRRPSYSSPPALQSGLRKKAFTVYRRLSRESYRRGWRAGGERDGAAAARRRPAAGHLRPG
jgi:hypothetical protein